jgi:hypothetical protein
VATPKTKAAAAAKPQRKVPAKAPPVGPTENSPDGPRFGVFRGAALTLPLPVIPATFAMDVAEMQATRNAGMLYSIVVNLAGADGWAKIRAKVAEDGDSLDDWEGTVIEIIGSVTDPYEVDEGK